MADVRNTIPVNLTLMRLNSYFNGLTKPIL
jgi:hypothetical protein